MLLPAFQPSWVYKKNKANYFKKLKLFQKLVSTLFVTCICRNFVCINNYSLKCFSGVCMIDQRLIPISKKCERRYRNQEISCSSSKRSKTHEQITVSLVPHEIKSLESNNCVDKMCWAKCDNISCGFEAIGANRCATSVSLWFYWMEYVLLSKHRKKSSLHRKS